MPTQVLRQEFVGGFLQRFPYHRGDERFARFQMARRLIEHQAVVGFFLDQEKSPVALDDGGNGDIGFPDHCVVAQTSFGNNSIRPRYMYSTAIAAMIRPITRVMMFMPVLPRRV